MNIKFLFNQYIYFTLVFFYLTAISLQAEQIDSYVLVTVAPHKFFVEKIAGDTVKVGLMVPAGASAHTYEPTPRQMMMASGASLWFCTGDSFEARAAKALLSHQPNLKIIDLRQGLDLINEDPSHQGCCHHNSMDLHFWLSTRMAQIQAKTIANALILTYPEHKELYQANLEKFQQELRNLDQEIQETLKSIKNRHIFVSHPAYAYFCRDYGLKQFSIEFEGKDPTPQQLHKIMMAARHTKVQTIFIQPQYNSKGARLIANEMGTSIITLDPYSENYFDSIREIAQAFAEG